MIFSRRRAKRKYIEIYCSKKPFCNFSLSQDFAWTYLQLPLRQWGAGNVYLLVFSSWKVNIAKNPIAVMGL